MSLPNITLFTGLDKDVELLGPGTSVFDFSVWDDVEFSCVSLGITKFLSSGADELEITGGGANVLFHILAADTSGSQSTEYLYMLRVKSGTKWFDVAGTGTVKLRNAA